MIAILLGLVASLGWGTANFYGGIASRRWPPIFITLYSYLCELSILLGIALLRGANFAIGDDIFWAMAAGALAVLSIAWFFHLLAQGNMALTAPLTALTYAIVPVLFGVVSIGWPKESQLAGIGIALLAIPLMAQSNTPSPIRNAWRQSLRRIGAPILAGIGFGFVLIFINQVAASDLLPPLVIARSTGSPLLFLLLLLSMRQNRAQPTDLKQLLKAFRPALAYALVIGVGDIIAYAAFIQSARLGGITIAAVMSSLPPAVTVLMARFIDKEHPRPAQVAGLALSLVAIVLISL
ncbi:MAG: DMT family transporter [Chloroflexi bacterium]|nr:DMT family transporter [Chloroflexota bacterium]MCY4106663.1 DMT family transporter [Chloroflexota bacterium]